LLKNAIGSCLPNPPTPPIAGEGVGLGALNKSKGKPEEPRPARSFADDDPLLVESDGSDSPPSPDKGVSSSANASKEMRSAAFLFGFALRSISLIHSLGRLKGLTIQPIVELYSNLQLYKLQTFPKHYLSDHYTGAIDLSHH